MDLDRKLFFDFEKKKEFKDLDEDEIKEYLHRIKRFLDAQIFTKDKKEFLFKHPFMIPKHILEQWEKDMLGSECKGDYKYIHTDGSTVSVTMTDNKTVPRYKGDDSSCWWHWLKYQFSKKYKRYTRGKNRCGVCGRKI